MRFREISPAHESFKNDVLPESKLLTLPTLVTASGKVIRDGAAIIEHFEAANDRPFEPRRPRQQLISALFDLVGVEGLRRPAMHYRWNFPDENQEFLHRHFSDMLRAAPDREQKTKHIMSKLNNVTSVLGVNEQTAPTVEALYLDFLGALDAHFAQVPYLLGWKPCIGDFGLLAPLYAHLGRDPFPADLMRRRAVHVFRWVERMNRADDDAAEFMDAGRDYLANDEVPDTIGAALRILAEEFVPETRAAKAYLNAWLADQPPAAGAAAERRFGAIEFEARGTAFTSVVHPYRFYMLQRVIRVYESADAANKQQLFELLQECGMAELLELGLNREVGMVGNLEVWL